MTSYEMIYQQASIIKIKDKTLKKGKTCNILHNTSTRYLIKKTSLMSYQDDIKEVFL